LPLFRLAEPWAEPENSGYTDVPEQDALKRVTLMSIVGHVLIVSKYLQHVYRDTEFVYFDSKGKIKIDIINFYLILSPHREILRTAVD
jgi:hypothetical protein